MEPGRIPIRTIALSQALQLGDDLTVEVRVRESKGDELYRSYSHVEFLFRSRSS
jgi:hypothetical protein